tara:strand:- start:469 stop:1605 length:1137 start_codon:yes stop_codon:yes gene_type:complete
MGIKQNKKIFFFYNSASFFISHRLEYSKFLQKKNYDINLVSSIDKHQNEKLKSLGVKCFSFSEYRTLNIIYFLKNLFFVRKIIKFQKPDICEFASHSMNIIGILSTIFLKTKNIFWITGMGSFFIDNKIKNIIIKILLLNIYRLNYFKKNSFLIIENKTDMNYLINKKCIKKDRVFLIFGSGVDKDKFSSKKYDLKSNIILMPCRIIKDKGVLDFLSLADNFYSRKILNYRFVLLGDLDRKNPSSLSNNQINRIESHPLLEWHKHTNDIKKYLEKTRLLLCLSYREGLPRILIESMFMSVPVMCYNVTGCKEIIINEYNGIMVKRGFFDILVSQLESLLKNNKKLQYLSLNCRGSLMDKCSSEKIFSQTYVIYEKLLK